MSGKELNELIQTGELAKGEIQAEQLKAAEEYAEEQLEEAKEDAKEDRDRRRIALIKFGSMAVLAAAIVIFASIAWFTMNREVGTSGMGVRISVSSFDIATDGNQVMHRAQFPKADNTYEEGNAATDGVVVNPDGSEETLSEYFISGNSKQNIMLEFTGTSEQATQELEPGGCGVIKFYIIPSADGNMNADINLNIRAFIEKTVTVEGTKQTQLLDVSTLTTESSGLTASQISDRHDALGYLNGHIFFFEEEGEPNDATSPYYYKKPITDGVYHFSRNVEAGKLYPVKIYWMWPKTYGQIVLKDNMGSKRSGIPVVEDSEYTVAGERTDKGKLLDFVKAKHLTGDFFNSHTTITSAMIDDSFANFKELSKGYNNADEIIGTNIRYMMLEVTVQ